MLELWKKLTGMKRGEAQSVAQKRALRIIGSHERNTSPASPLPVYHSGDVVGRCWLGSDDHLDGEVVIFLGHLAPTNEADCSSYSRLRVRVEETKERMFGGTN